MAEDKTTISLLWQSNLCCLWLQYIYTVVCICVSVMQYCRVVWCLRTTQCGDGCCSGAVKPKYSKELCILWYKHQIWHTCTLTCCEHFQVLGHSEFSLYVRHIRFQNGRHLYHKMHNRFAMLPHYCACGQIWLKTAFQCTECEMVCHKKCVERCQLATSCSRHRYGPWASCSHPRAHHLPLAGKVMGIALVGHYRF